MLKYYKNTKFNPEKLDPLNIDRLSTSLIPEGSKVLEIGCATGFMGEYLIKNKKCEVVGIDLAHGEAKEARKRLTSVIEGDIEKDETLEKIKGKFDVVFASALIEHLKNPNEAIKKWKKFLKRDGVLIITTPNIAHWSMRLALLSGKFDYQEYGILDDTHLHFFTTETFKKLFTENGYKVDEFLIDSVGGGHPRIARVLSRYSPNLFAYQMVVKASMK